MVIVNNNYLITARINLGRFFGVPEADAYVELREPSTFDALKMEKAAKGGEPEESLAVFREILPRLIVEHNLYRSESEKLSPEEVVEAMVEKMELFSFVVTEYSARVLFSLGKGSAEK